MVMDMLITFEFAAEGFLCALSIGHGSRIVRASKHVKSASLAVACAFECAQPNELPLR